MKQEEIRIRFDAGELGSCVAAPDPVARMMDPTLSRPPWVLIVQDRKGKCVVMEAKRSGSPRKFATLEALVNTTKAIGFQEVTVSQRMP